MLIKKILPIFLLLLSTIILAVNSNKEESSVIIVGAGASGIAAASKLFQNGFKNVKILEAENRIGGRVFTTKFGDNLIDLGGQWIHGEEGNIAFELAWPLGVVERGGLLSGLNYLIIDSSGNLVNQTITEDIIGLFFKLKDELSIYSEKNNGSIGEFFVAELNKYFKDHPELKDKTEGISLLFDMMQMGNDAGDSWWEVSTTSISEFKDSPGDYMVNWKERGYGTILDILMKRFPNSEEELPVMNNTILNAEVVSIDYSDSNGKVKVKTVNGDTHSADHVIFTCSLGVLKDRHNSLFQPPLSEEKQKTIKGLGFGSEAKILLSFENPVWINDTTYGGFTILWNKEDIEKLEKDPERNWMLGLVGFFFVEHKPRLLYAWISGNYSREMEKLSEQKVFNQTVELLHRFVGKHREVPTPTGMIRSMWNSNKNFLGTYSFRSLKSDADNSWSSILAKPIDDTKPVILFAGEATNSEHFSTVHGAIETGHREADRIIKHYSN
ncbi:protein anon-37Cs-like [Leptopilina heterotoma]|uniref:protein anon-37Cs-like n=1 Tax=Leptopilina heterotoma TaxID=63436 RepID=UPI001CA91174|nr:protein anon-37Cs-like [Leptopilina heterotoma]